MDISKYIRNRTLEQKISGVIIIAVAIYGFLNTDRIREYRKQKEVFKNDTDVQVSQVTNDEKQSRTERIQKVPSHTERVADHPVTAWFLENIHPWSKALLMTQLGKLWKVPGSYWLRVLRGTVLFSISEELTVAYFWWLTNVVYKHIPFFSEKWKPQSLRTVLLDFLQCNLPVHFAFNLLIANAEPIERAKSISRGIYPSHFRPLIFMFKLIVVRLVTDFFFFVGHYLLHLKFIYFIHRKHHEHRTVRVSSNYHFTAPDFALEAFVPFIVADILVGKLHPSLSNANDFEGIALSAYVLQLEVASHSGKPLPTMSFFPPFTLFTRYWDDWNSWFHANHHRIQRCNYSITPFWDWVFGTDRY